MFVHSRFTRYLHAYFSNYGFILLLTVRYPIIKIAISGAQMKPPVRWLDHNTFPLPSSLGIFGGTGPRSKCVLVILECLHC